MRGQHRSGLCAGRKILGFNLWIEVDLVRRPSLVERLQEPKTNVFFRAAKPDAQNSVGNLIMTRVFQIVFRHQVITNAGTQQREDGSTMRYAKRFLEIFASSLDSTGIDATVHLSPSRSSMVLATRVTRNIRFTLGGLSLGVIFSSRWICRSRSSTAISQTATTLLVLDEEKLWLRNITATPIVDDHNNDVPTARGDT